MSIIPNLFTFVNLLCGCAGIVLALSGQLPLASWCIAVALVADFLDGLLARLLKAESEIGKQLDSMADLISFGLLPGVMLYQFITIGFGEYFVPVTERVPSHILLSLAGFLVPLFAALRLAKFTIGQRQRNQFLGLPTPAVAMVVGSFPLVMETQFNINFYYPVEGVVFAHLKAMYRWDAFDIAVVTAFFNPWFHAALAAALSALMTLPLPLFSLKVKNIRWKENRVRYIFLILVALLILVSLLPYWFWVPVPYFEYLLAPIIVVMYIVVSIINNIISARN